VKKIILSLIGFIFFSSSFSQEQKEIEEKQILVFNTAVLDTLLCIDYSDVTFGEYNKIIDYNLDGKTELTEENVKKMFLGNKKAVEIRNYLTDEVVDTITAEQYLKNRTFYLRDIVSSNKKWTAIIIEEITDDTWDMYSDKYLVTIDKKQNLISKYRIAYYGRFGTYTCCDEDENGNIIQYEDEDEYGNIIMRVMCGRCPWYTGDSGYINKDLTIRLEGRINNQAFIDKKGNIIKIEQ
jgi:hypothetical protein